VADVDSEGVLLDERTPRHPIGTFFGVNPWEELDRMRARIQSLEQRLE
jgi:hypothetical protein